VLTASKDQHIYFISGKGGVGKSTLALACARNLASQGFKTLLVEMNTHSYFQRLLKQPIEHNPREVQKNLFVANWRAESCLREYVLHYLKLERLFEIFFQNRVMRAFIDIAPGLVEISLLGKITSGIRKIGPPMEYDRLVVDCFASGHALAFFRAPQGLAQAVQVGPMGEQSRAIDIILRDPKFCSYWLVTTLEELPAVETVELAQSLRKDLGISSQIIANRVLPALVPPQNVPQNLQPFVSQFNEEIKQQDHWRQHLKSTLGDQLRELPLVRDPNPDAVLAQITQGIAPC
jgi:hypothetical protein